jgi:hypothetical protein
MRGAVAGVNVGQANVVPHQSVYNYMGRMLPGWEGRRTVRTDFVSNPTTLTTTTT